MRFQNVAFRLGRATKATLFCSAALAFAAPNARTHAQAGQVPPATPRMPQGMGQHEPPDARSPFDPLMLQHMREAERHKRLEEDTAKLLALTNELKTEVDKASKDELSLDVVRKAGEIEKLAHDVKERMKG